MSSRIGKPELETGFKLLHNDLRTYMESKKLDHTTARSFEAYEQIAAQSKSQGDFGFVAASIISELGLPVDRQEVRQIRHTLKVAMTAHLGSMVKELTDKLFGEQTLEASQKQEAGHLLHYKLSGDWRSPFVKCENTMPNFARNFRTVERYIETPSADIAAYKLFIYDMYQIYNGAIKPVIHSLHELAAYRQHKAYLGRSAHWLRREPAGSDVLHRLAALEKRWNAYERQLQAPVEITRALVEVEQVRNAAKQSLPAAAFYLIEKMTRPYQIVKACGRFDDADLHLIEPHHLAREFFTKAVIRFSNIIYYKHKLVDEQEKQARELVQLAQSEKWKADVDQVEKDPRDALAVNRFRYRLAFLGLYLHSHSDQTHKEDGIKHLYHHFENPSTRYGASQGEPTKEEKQAFMAYHPHCQVMGKPLKDLPADHPVREHISSLNARAAQHPALRAKPLKKKTSLQSQSSRPSTASSV